MDTAKQTLVASRLEFLATPALVDTIMHGKFAMVSAYQPCTGLQPFIVPRRDAAQLNTSRPPSSLSVEKVLYDLAGFGYAQQVEAQGAP